MGQFSSLIFNINVASSITAQGRSLISSASLFFESFLANNVQFGSLNEVLEFINHICHEERHYDDNKMLDNNVSIEDCFAKLVLTCGYRYWYPDQNEMDIIWRILNNLGTEDINRIYYKNNLYEFMSNTSMKKAIIYIMKKLKSPFFNPLEVPEEIEDELCELSSILTEYVYYGKMYIDRIDRCDNMIKKTIMVSDTDSCIVSLDAWYHFIYKIIKDEELQIKKYDPINVIHFVDRDEFGDIIDLSQISAVHFEEPEEHYDFENDKITEERRALEPLVLRPCDYLKYSIINILAYVIDDLINLYMKQFTINNHSWAEGKKCKIIMKNEFTFLRLLMTDTKKSYASRVTVQEGNRIPEDEQLDVKGIASMAKSSMALSTRKALKKILFEDILKAETIDQFKVIEHLAIMERKIINSIMEGSKEYYKPVTIKSINNYEDPMRIQGVKASYVWNEVKDESLPAINLDERNAISIAKVLINPKTIEKIKDTYPDVYEKLKVVMNNEYFKGKIDAIAIPLEEQVPGWLLDLIDYKTILQNNLGGFVYDSIGLVNLGGNTNYSNILQF